MVERREKVTNVRVEGEGVMSLGYERKFIEIGVFYSSIRRMYEHQGDSRNRR